jgi:hypothetical protein
MGAGEQFRSPGGKATPCVEQRDLGLPPVERGVQGRQVADLERHDDQPGAGGEEDDQGRRRALRLRKAEGED